VRQHRATALPRVCPQHEIADMHYLRFGAVIELEDQVSAISPDQKAAILRLRPATAPVEIGGIPQRAYT
jgi:hypothetical protein